MSFVLAWPAVGWTATLSVPAQHPTLAAAVAAAAAGDRIEVDASYTATEPALAITRGVTVAGVGGRPLLRTSAPEGLFQVSGQATLVLEQLAFDGQNTSRAVWVTEGGALVSDCTFSDVSADGDGGAIRVDGGSANVLQVVDSVFTNGSATGTGGFVAATEGSVTLTGSTFSNAIASAGGHVAVDAGVSLEVDRCAFDSGVATGDGGAIDADGKLIVRRSSFLENSAVRGGALRAKGGLTLTESLLRENLASDFGAGVWQEAGDSTYDRVVFCANAATNFGGGLYQSAGAVIGSSLVFERNLAPDAGGGVRITATASLSELSHLSFVGNESTVLSGQALSGSVGIPLTDTWVGDHLGTKTAVQTSSPSVLSWVTFSGNADDTGGSVDVSDPSNVLTDASPAVAVSANDCSLTSLTPAVGDALFAAASDGQNRGALLGDGSWPDADGDGADYLADCEDDPAEGGATIGPSAAELVADGVDQDCSGGDTCYGDADGDGAPDDLLVESVDLDCSDLGEGPAPTDTCPGYDDRLDADADGIPDGCDVCPGADGDEDGDGVCDDLDQCPGFDDHLDTDGDGLPNGCDDCSQGGDTDGDGVVDDCDLCDGFDDAIDRDGDQAPDGCDPCPDDPPDDDDDDDGVCDLDDVCPEGDDGEDDDLDNIPDACDGCPGAVGDDTDGDGVCDPIDPCVRDAPDDPDQDGICTSADPCPDDPDPSCALPERLPGAPPSRVVGCGCRTSGLPGMSAVGWAAGLAALRRRQRRAR